MGDERIVEHAKPLPTNRVSSISLPPLGVDDGFPGPSPTATDGANSSSSSIQVPAKKTPNDFIFVRQIGEGSFSTVFRAREVDTGREFAIKTCEKRLLKKERKIPYVMREKEVMTILNKNLHPFFVRLYCTFQDDDRLYFAMTLAANGEILDYLRKLGSFDEQVTRFYAAEAVLALEHLHSLGIIHRDLKPENMLLSESMHILISDFGSAKILSNGYTDVPTPLLVSPVESQGGSQRRGSFVGTAQYVSPEVLNGQRCTPSVDYWALGCIVYQMLSGLPPFRAANEYLVFQKIIKLEYSFPDGFPSVAKEFVQDLMKLVPDERLGSTTRGGSVSLKKHPFFASEISQSVVDASNWWSSLSSTKPPAILPYLPSLDGSEDFHSNYNVLPDHVQPGLDDSQLTRLMGLELGSFGAPPEKNDTSRASGNYQFDMTEEERRTRMESQRKGNAFHRFVEGNLILKSGLVDKRKGLFARRRMLLLTEGPHLYYVDPVHMDLKGQIPWSKQIRAEPKNFRIFFVHTTHRTYYLEDPQGRSTDWCEAIEQVRRFYLDSLPETNAPPKKP